MDIDTTPHHPTPGLPQTGRGERHGVGWGDINTHIDININIDINIVISINIDIGIDIYILILPIAYSLYVWGLDGGRAGGLVPGGGQM